MAEFRDEIRKIIKKNQDEMDRLINYYVAAPSQQEARQKINLELWNTMDQLDRLVSKEVNARSCEHHRLLNNFKLHCGK